MEDKKTIKYLVLGMIFIFICNCYLTYKKYYLETFGLSQEGNNVKITGDLNIFNNLYLTNSTNSIIESEKPIYFTSKIGFVQNDGFNIKNNKNLNVKSDMTYKNLSIIDSQKGDFKDIINKSERITNFIASNGNHFEIPEKLTVNGNFEIKGENINIGHWNGNQTPLRFLLSDNKLYIQNNMESNNGKIYFSFKRNNHINSNFIMNKDYINKRDEIFNNYDFFTIKNTSNRYFISSFASDKILSMTHIGLRPTTSNQRAIIFARKRMDDGRYKLFAFGKPSNVDRYYDWGSCYTDDWFRIDFSNKRDNFLYYFVKDNDYISIVSDNILPKDLNRRYTSHRNVRFLGVLKGDERYSDLVSYRNMDNTEYTIVGVKNNNFVKNYSKSRYTIEFKTREEIDENIIKKFIDYIN